MGTPVRVIVEHRRAPSGCGTTLLVLILLGLAIKYWYVVLVIAVLATVVAVQRHSEQKARQLRRPGPQDPWLDQVAVALADHGLVEHARNTGAHLGGAPLEGDIGLRAERFEAWVNLFATPALARRAELGLRATPGIRDAITAGRTAVRTHGRVVYLATGRGGAVDEFRLDDVLRVVGRLRTQPPLGVPDVTRLGASPAAQRPVVGADVLEQLRRLAQLQRDGVISSEEFEAKKAELLDRL